MCVCVFPYFSLKHQNLSVRNVLWRYEIITSWKTGSNCSLVPIALDLPTTRFSGLTLRYWPYPDFRANLVSSSFTAVKISSGSGPLPKKNTIFFNPTALRMVKTRLSFGHSECKRVNIFIKVNQQIMAGTLWVWIDSIDVLIFLT